MGSETNNINDGTTSFQPSDSTLCANGCGFFGSSATMNLCSKCFRDVRTEEEQAASAKVAVTRLMNRPNMSKSQRDNDAHVGGSSGSGVPHAPPAVVEKEEEEVVVERSNRCLSCRKKVGIMGFKCRCGSTFCGSHRYPEKHDCGFDFKGRGKEEIQKANPVIKGDKLESRV